MKRVERLRKKAKMTSDKDKSSDAAASSSNSNKALKRQAGAENIEVSESPDKAKAVKRQFSSWNRTTMRRK